MNAISKTASMRDGGDMPHQGSARLAALPSAAIRAAIDHACGRIAPLWPLADFVAVNPFLGFAAEDFAQAAAELAAVRGVQALPGMARTPESGAPASGARVTSLAALHDARHGSMLAEAVTRAIGNFCAAYWDEGQAPWTMPGRDAPLFAAWRRYAMADRTARLLGLRNAARVFARLPDDAQEAIAQACAGLQLDAAALPAYFQHLLGSISGFAGHAAYRAWQARLQDRQDDAPVQLLAICLAWELALHDALGAQSSPAWCEARAAMACPIAPDATLQDLLDAQQQRERVYQCGLLAALAGNAATASRSTAPTPQIQAVFCIDVRSEVLRRQLEAQGDGIATLGFAGFFGIALRYGTMEEARCPVLLRPGLRACDVPQDAARGAGWAAGARREAARLWSNFRLGAISAFAQVELEGPLSGLKLARGKPSGAAPAPAAAVTLDGVELAQRVDMAAGILRGMGLAADFAPLVLICGHGSDVVNSPYRAALACGACGGHAGDVNARIAASLLNDPALRRQLAASHGIAIPRDTVFIAGLHDTASDEITLFADPLHPPKDAQLASLRTALARASAATRAARARKIAGACGDDLLRRGQNWAELRPEWALANNASFIAAPRARTAGIDLDGRSFLHEYDHRRDPDGAVLELIMTAPMIVASWINLQYYGSTVDPVRLGAGDKLLHNVTGRIGCLQGASGDIATGLPLQSVHDGVRMVHEPLRLSVVIEAPRAAIDQVISRHAAVAQLVQNRWLHLFAIEGDDRILRKLPDLSWSEESIA